MPEDYVIIATGGSIWHHPAADSTRDDPKPKCHDEHGGGTPNWATRRAEIATAWWDECSYCDGSFRAATDQASLPTSTEVAGDD
jgi:hypothetical protein